MAAICWANQKGGTGKTTLAVLWAYHASDKRKESTCVIDLDPQANASTSLQAYDCGIPSTALFQSGRIAVAADGPERIVLFPASKGLVDLERGNPATILPAFIEQIQNLNAIFDNCVIDTPPSLGLRMSAALMASDFVCCPIELEQYSIDGVTDMLKTIVGIRQKYNEDLKMLGIVANRFNPNSQRQRNALEELLSEYSEFVVPAKVSTRTAIPEALEANVPVWRLAKTAARDASAEVLALFELLRKRMTEPAQL